MKQAFSRWLRSMARPRMERRIPAVLLSILMMGFCVAVLDRINFGTDPCSCLNMGISRAIGWSFGTWQMTCNIGLFLIVICFDTSRIGLGTFVNALGVGYAADFFMFLLDFFPGINAAMPMLWRIAIFLPVGLLFLLVVSVYIVVDMGVAPYDAMPQIIAGRTGIAFTWTRTAWDVAVILGALALGSRVGPMTLLVAFCLGPMVGVVSKKIEPFFS